MKSESYTPGHTSNATSFMATRTVDSHGQFFASHIDSENRILDAGCGPGTISLVPRERIDVAPGAQST